MSAYIHESRIIADLILELHHHIENDTPFTDVLAVSVKRRLTALILVAWRRSYEDIVDCDPEWIARLKNDPVLQALAVIPWQRIEVVDADGTIKVFTKDPSNAEPVSQSTPLLQHGRSRYPRR